MKNSENTKLQTVQEFLNINKIKNNLVYTVSGNLYSYIKIRAIQLDLLSSEEIKASLQRLVATLSSFDEPFYFLAISKPVDITAVIETMAQNMRLSDDIKKTIIKKEIGFLNSIAMDGEAFERQFYIYINAKGKNAEDNILRKIDLLIEKLNEGGLKAEKCTDSELILLVNLINNPFVTDSYLAPDTEPNIPMINMY